MKLPNTTLCVIAPFLLLIACSQQGEGERCIVTNNSADCDTGLICTDARNLRESERYSKTLDNAADRCCLEGTWTDSRCERQSKKASPTASGGTASTTSSSTAGTAGAISEDSGMAGMTGAISEDSGMTGMAGNGA